VHNKQIESWSMWYTGHCWRKKHEHSTVRHCC